MSGLEAVLNRWVATERRVRISPIRLFETADMATPAGANTRLRFGTFEIDLVGKDLFQRGAPVCLQDKPFQILAFLLERVGGELLN